MQCVDIKLFKRERVIEAILLEKPYVLRTAQMVCVEIVGETPV